jgi:hypothetical protein
LGQRELLVLAMTIANALSVDVMNIVITVTAFVIVAFIGWFAKALAKMVKVQDVVTEQIMGRVETKQLPAIPSLHERFTVVDERFDAQDAQLLTLEHEVLENDGSSVKDAVNRVETAVIAVGNKLAEHLGTMADEQKALITREAAVAKMAIDAASGVASTAVETASGLARTTLDTASRLSEHVEHVEHVPVKRVRKIPIKKAAAKKVSPK